MSEFRYGGGPASPARGKIALPILTLVCRCGGEWKGSARTDARLVDGLGPELPLMAEPACPKCGDPGNLAAVRP